MDKANYAVFQEARKSKEKLSIYQNSESSWHVSFWNNLDQEHQGPKFWRLLYDKTQCESNKIWSIKFQLIQTFEYSSTSRSIYTVNACQFRQKIKESASHINDRVSETTQEWESGRNDPEGNDKTGETARISHCRNKTMNMSPSEW